MTYNKSSSSSLLLIILLCFILSPSLSGALPKPAYISLTHENDLFTTNDRDRHYTSGLRLSFISDEFDEFDKKNSSDWVRNAFNSTNLVSGDGYKRSIVYGLAQFIGTPEVVEETKEQPDDLPYSGLLYWFYSMNGQKKTKGESLTLMAGIIGPLSMSEESQKAIHRVVKSDSPRGWKHQLKNEAALNIGYDRRYLLYSSPDKKWSYHLVGTGSFHLGNILTGGNVSFTFVLGQKGSFNPLSIKPDLMGRATIAANSSTEKGVFFWVGAGTDIYIHTYFLDGNSFRDGPHVHKKPIVHNWFTGLGYNWLKLSTHIGWIDQGKIFDGQKDGGMEYGTINITYRY